MRKSRLLIGAVAALALGAALFGVYRLMNSGPKLAADTPVLFQWEDMSTAPFLADYRSRYNETPRLRSTRTKTKPLPSCAPATSPTSWDPAITNFALAGSGPAATHRRHQAEKLEQGFAGAARASRHRRGSRQGLVRAHYWGNTSVTFRTDLAPEYVGRDTWDILFDPSTKAASRCSKASTTRCPSSPTWSASTRTT